MGIEEINSSCPTDMKPYIDSYRLFQEQQDTNNWLLGSYIENAVLVAVEKNLAGRKAKAKYVDKPFLQKAKEENGELSEMELQRQRELFVAECKIRQANFRLYQAEQKKKEIEKQLE